MSFRQLPAWADCTRTAVRCFTPSDACVSTVPDLFSLAAVRTASCVRGWVGSGWLPFSRPQSGSVRRSWWIMRLVTPVGCVRWGSGFSSTARLSRIIVRSWVGRGTCCQFIFICFWLVVSARRPRGIGFWRRCGKVPIGRRLVGFRVGWRIFFGGRSSAWGRGWRAVGWGYSCYKHC
jgi:hypothetical protein